MVVAIVSFTLAGLLVFTYAVWFVESRLSQRLGLVIAVVAYLTLFLRDYIDDSTLPLESMF